jgi:hypothetical protein
MVITAVQAFFAEKVAIRHYRSLCVTIAAPGGWNSDRRREGQARLAQAERMASPGVPFLLNGPPGLPCFHPDPVPPARLLAPVGVGPRYPVEVPDEVVLGRSGGHA